LVGVDLDGDLVGGDVRPAEVVAAEVVEVVEVVEVD
jgi:hypothetical protein